MDDLRDEDARCEFVSALKNADSLTYSVSIYTGFIRAAIDEASERKAPFTKLLIFITLAVFSVQIGLFFRVNQNPLGSIVTLLTERGALEGLNAWFFIHHPSIAWPLTEFIHRGLGHFLVNVGLLALFGSYVEPGIRRRYYVLWFLLVVVTATPIHALQQMLITTKPYVAVYGISDFVAALGLFSLLWIYGKAVRTELEYVALLLGGLIVLQTLIELINAVLIWSLEPVNVGHLVGGLVGVIAFGFYRRWELDLSP